MRSGSLIRHQIEHISHACHPLRVHSLGVLTEGRIRDKQISVIIDSLVKFISSKEEELRDIASLALKTVVGSLPAGSTPARLAFDSLTPKLLSAVGDVSTCSMRRLALHQPLTLYPLPPYTQSSSSQELIIDSLDVLADLFLRFPRSVAENGK